MKQLSNPAWVCLFAVLAGSSVLCGERETQPVQWIETGAEPLDINSALQEPPSGPEAIAPLGEGLLPLPCKTPVALPYSRRKAFVAGSGLLQSLLSTPSPRGMGGNIAGPGLQVKLAGRGPWKSVEQTVVNVPLPMVLTRLKWPEVEIEQAVFAAAPEEQGFFMRVTVTNKTATAQEFKLVSLLRNVATVEVADGQRLVALGQPLLRMLPAPGVLVSVPGSALPGPLGGSRQLRHPLKLAAGASTSFDLQFLGGGLHLNLGYSRGVWPYLSAEVALWHLRLGETEEAWRILRAIVDRASSTVCWYEEIEHQPPSGHGDPADIWAAAETVYLARQLVLAGRANKLNDK